MANQHDASSASASDNEQTPVDPAIRKTGSGDKTETVQPEAKVEAGESSPIVEGDPSQGTESR